MRPIRPKPLVSSPEGSSVTNAASGSSVNSDPVSANTPSTPGIDQADVLELEALTRTITTLFNERDYTNSIILDHIAADFCFESDYVQACSTLAEYLLMCQSMDTMYPTYHLRIMDLSTELIDGHHAAEVLVHFEITGAPESVKRQRMSVCKWKKVDEHWLWYFHGSMRMPACEFGDNTLMAGPSD